MDISTGMIFLSSEDSAHMRSLRMRPTELFVVCDGEGFDHICRLGGGGGTVAQIVETRPSVGEPTIHCSVFIALAKGDRLDYAVQKSVELGAKEVILYLSERCVSVPGDIGKKVMRLQRVALEAAKQSGRGQVPLVTTVPMFVDAIVQAARAALPLFLYECEEETRLKEVLDSSGIRDPDTEKKTISIVTGPEGGFTPQEASLAKEAGMRSVTLGPRILRCETAPAAVLAAVMFHTGNL